MLFIYRKKFSDGASLLAEELNDAGVPARYTQGGVLRTRPLRAGKDRVIMWGDRLDVPEGVPVLNNVAIQSKYQDALTLKEKGIRTVEVSLTVPPTIQTRGMFRLVEDAGLNPAATLTSFDEATARRVVDRVQEWLSRPLPSPATWLARKNSHVGGNDLLSPGRGDYYSKKENLTHEYRLHIFNGKSIRAGEKVRREFRPDGITPSHEWIRSFDAGWIIRYEGFSSTKEMRKIAADAVAALGLQFGAVDLAQTADGELLVLEVNRAPGIEGGSVAAYVEAIKKWIGGN